ncbi:hypothetical protein [Ottowia sp. VDI28]|uniref:hypothetical protein n=1 Tax=Ottowia sp. VDI28 TaxID=3133968 RepID=UPI003C30646D
MSAPTKKQLASRHVRRLRTMRKQLTDMSCEWEDLDQFCANELDRLARAVEDVAVSLLDEDSGESSI